MWIRPLAIYINLRLYLRTITLFRLFNLLKLSLSFFLSRILKKPLGRAHPFALSIEPSGSCQLKCPECPTGAAILSRARGLMNTNTFEKILTETDRFLIYLNLYFQGEPLMHPKLHDLIKIASDRKIYTAISTNGLLLNKRLSQKIIESGLSRIIVSLDGFTQPVYEIYRKGGNVEEVKKGITNLIRARNEFNGIGPLIVVQTIAFEHNIPELNQIKAWCKKVGVDKLELKSAQINDFGDGSVKPWQKKSRYINNNNNGLILKGKIYNHCWRHWSSSVISWNGDVAPCCYDKDISHNMGNTSTFNFNKIWKNKKYRDFKYDILNHRSKIEMCRNCPEGRNWLM